MSRFTMSRQTRCVRGSRWTTSPSSCWSRSPRPASRSWPSSDAISQSDPSISLKRSENSNLVSTALVKYAQTKAWDLGDVTVTVQYDHLSTPRRFELEIELTRQVTEEQLVRMRKVVTSCPVRRAVETGFEFSERFKLTDGSGCEIASLEGHDREAGRGERDHH